MQIESRSRINTDSKFRANRFLRVHLHILKALYEQERVGATSGEALIEEKNWVVIQDFLIQRNTIKRATKRAQHMREIHDEAMEFQRSAPALCAINDHIFSHQFSPKFQRYTNCNGDTKAARSSFKVGSSTRMLITQPSPHYLPTRQHLGWNGRGSLSGGRRNEAQGDVMENDGGSTFGIVSGLLKRKHRLVSRNLDRRTSKLQALLKETQSRIETLQSNLNTEKEDKTSTVDIPEESIQQFMMEKEECEDRQVRIETKIRLWKLLLHDLSGTI